MTTMTIDKLVDCFGCGIKEYTDDKIRASKYPDLTNTGKLLSALLKYREESRFAELLKRDTSPQRRSLDNLIRKLKEKENRWI